MLNKLDATIGFHREALNLREQRQQILAANIANSDTPNYQARDINFNAELTKAINQEHHNSTATVTLNTTATHHIGLKTPTTFSQNVLYRVPYQASADGNTVDMDKERMEFMDNSLHYQSSLTFLGEQFKNLMVVLQQG